MSLNYDLIFSECISDDSIREALLSSGQVTRLEKVNEVGAQGLNISFNRPTWRPGLGYYSIYERSFGFPPITRIDAWVSTGPSCFDAQIILYSLVGLLLARLKGEAAFVYNCDCPLLVKSHGSVLITSDKSLWTGAPERLQEQTLLKSLNLPVTYGDLPQIL